jgi:hypothetical protein
MVEQRQQNFEPDHWLPSPVVGSASVVDLSRFDTAKLGDWDLVDLAGQAADS